MFGSIESKVQKIAGLGEKKKTDKILKFATVKEPQLRIAAAKALAGIAQDESYNQLVLMTRDPDLGVRKAAVTALGDMGRKSGADHVRHVMASESDPEIIKLCQVAVSKIVNSESHR